MHSRKFIYYFDYLSPFSYLSWKWLYQNMPLIKNRFSEINLVGVSLVPIIKYYETKGPAEIAPKRNYLMKYCMRYAKLNNISFKCPPHLPFNSSAALRISLGENFPNLNDQINIIDKLFNFSWGRGGDLSDPEELKACVGERFYQYEEIKENRRLLKKNIKQAQGNDIFGVPSFLICDGDLRELFWGNESTLHLEYFLSDKDPLDKMEFNSFLDKVN